MNEQTTDEYETTTVDAVLQLEHEHAALESLLAEAGLAEGTVLERVTTIIAQRDDARSKYDFMVDRAVNTKLDGYRELGSKLCLMEEQRDKALGELRHAHERIRSMEQSLALYGMGG